MIKMSFDLLRQIKVDCDKKILNSFISNVSVVSSTEILLMFSFYKEEKFIISLNHHNPFCTLVDTKEKYNTIIGQTNDNLRKYLSGAYLKEIAVKELDRVMTFTLYKTNDLFEKNTFYLVIELIPHRSNLLVLDENKKILFATHYTGLDHARPVIKGLEYSELPMMQQNLSEDVSLEDFKEDVRKYFEEINAHRHKDLYASLFTKVKSRIKSLHKKIGVLEEGIEKANQALAYMDMGNLLYSIQGDESLLEEYIKEGYIKDYDSSKSINENAALYFKKYKKAKSTIVHNSEEIAKANQEILENEKLLRQLEIGDDIDLQEMKQYLLKEEPVKGRKRPQSKISPSYVVYKGKKIGFGKTDQQNNVLTFEKSKPNYEFFHIKDYPGSHVVIMDDNIDNETRNIACEICLILAKREDGEIQSTKIKNVKKSDSIGRVNLKEYVTYTIKKVSLETHKLLETAVRF